MVTETKRRKMERNRKIKDEFAGLAGMKTAKYEYLANKYDLSRISIIKIILEDRQ